MPRRPKKKYYFIYKTTCLINNKFYIGMHSTSNLEDGYLGSGIKLKRSIIKYGKENHIIERCEFLNNMNELKKREKEIVNRELLKDPLCMNLSIGGSGSWYASNSNSILQTKKWEKALFKIKYLLENDHEWVKKYRENQSISQKESYEKGRKIITPDVTGMKHSKETKLKIGQANILKQKGVNNSQYGTCWITNEKENRKIKKGDLISEGWRLGRKIN